MINTNNYEREEAQKRLILLKLDYVKLHITAIEPKARAMMSKQNHQNFKAWLLENNWVERIDWIQDHIDSPNHIADIWLKYNPFDKFIPPNILSRFKKNTNVFLPLNKPVNNN